jgi:hypothetical protein
VQPASASMTIPNKAAIATDVRFVVFILLLLKWLLNYSFLFYSAKVKQKPHSGIAVRLR